MEDPLTSELGINKTVRSRFLSMKGSSKARRDVLACRRIWPWLSAAHGGVTLTALTLGGAFTPRVPSLSTVPSLQRWWSRRGQLREKRKPGGGGLEGAEGALPPFTHKPSYTVLPINRNPTPAPVDPADLLPPEQVWGCSGENRSGHEPLVALFYNP